MKKILSIITVLLSFSLQGFAQQYINLYQDDVVIRQLSTEEIDSMSVTETEPNMINFWYDGKIFLSYNAVDIDSIKVTSQGGAPFSYMGIVGFNSQLKTKDINILSTSTESQYRSFVNNLPRQDGTILYYAVDNALDMLDEANIDSPLKSVHFITFTDGLDQGSLMMTDKYGSSTEYLNAISSRIADAEINDLPVNVYCLGLRGNDVSDVTLFRQNLQKLSSSPDNAFEVSDISGFRSKLQEIANQIISVSTRQTMSVKIPGIDSGTKVRFVFDGKAAESSELYIEGTFNLQDRSLHDVTYHGIKATSGKTVQGTQDGIFVTYTFTGMRRSTGEGLIPVSSVRYYYCVPSSTSWQANSEFSPAGNTQRNVSHSGTAIMLVLDCSSSLGSDFSSMQSYANEFINLIATNAEPFKLVTPKNVKAQLDENDLVVKVSWDAVQYAQSYKVYRSSSYNGTYQLVAEGITAISWTDNSPLQGYNYYKVCTVGYGVTSSQSSYTSVNVTLNAPTNVNAQLDANDLVVNVSWDAVKNAKSYNVYRSSSSSGTYQLVAEGITATFWTDNSPLQGYNYYKVCAVNRNITSSQSAYTSVNVTLNTPTNVKAELGVNETNFIVNVSWDAVQYAQSYKVYRSSSSDGTYDLVAENIATAFWTDNSPLKGNNYYKVCAVGYGVTSIQSSYTSVNVTLNTPTNIKAELGVNETSFIVNVSWDAVQYAQSYKVYRSSSSDGTYDMVAENIATAFWTDNSPLKGNNYYKVCAVGYGVTSTQSSYTSVNVILNTPTNIKAELGVNETNFIVNVSWNPVQYAQSYKVYRSSSYNGTYQLVAEGITAISWTDNSPLKGNNYYKVCAVGYGVTSTQSSYTSVNVILNTPTNIKAELGVNETNFIVNVSWNAVQYAQSYKVYRSSSYNGTYQLVAEGITAISWTDNSPLQGYNYYKVCTVGYGVTSSQSSYTSVNVTLNAPTNVNAQLDANDLVVNVSWDAVKNAKSYNVYRSSSSSGTYQLVAEGITATFWTDNSPLQGYNYYKVCAVNRNITSSQSSYVSVHVSLNAPTNVKDVVDETNWIVNLFWDAVKYAQSYNVYRGNSYNGTYQLVAKNVTSNSWTDNNLLDGYNFYKVKAVSKGIESEWSNVVAEFNYGTSKYEYVDLGLPSGTLWATRNIGANSPEDYGDYFAWGETKGYNSGKTNFYWSTYKWCSSSKISMTKYSTKPDYGTVDNKIELDLEDDAAYVNWGQKWRMPSIDQFRELINSSYTTTLWTTQNGIYGRKITSKKNGNSIFLPAAGYRYESSLYKAGSSGDYWSRMLDSDVPNYAWYLDFDSSDYHSFYRQDVRSSGRSVRPVRRLSE